jgi:hypothetical protein
VRSNSSAPTRFARQDYFPKGWEFCVQQFLGLFHRYGHILKPLGGGSWFSANESWRLDDSQVLKAIAGVHPKFYLGCRAGKTTRFAVLDIDANSKYHNKKSLDKLLQLLSDAGLAKSSLYRSSYSGGWHLYIFFDEPLNSTDLRNQIVRLLTVGDFQISKGTLEVFPHPGEGSLGLGLRLPLQPGFAWLNKKTLDVEYERDDVDATTALELFVDALDGGANSYNAFRRLKAHIEELELRKEKAIAQGQGQPTSNVVPLRRTDRNHDASEFADFVCAVFQKLPPGIIVDNWYKGRIYHLNGLTGASQRAESIECLGHYFFYGDPSRDLQALGYGYEQEREWAINEFLTARHNGFSQELNNGHSDARAQVERAANWKPARLNAAQVKKYSVKRSPAWVRENINRKADARKRITAALEAVKKHGRQFTTVELQEQAGCSRRTLYDHSDIWRKDYDDLADGFFAICTDEYNGVERAGSSETKPSATTSSKITPPGLLAARRIVYELSMRHQRDIKRKTRVQNEEIVVAEQQWRDKVSVLTKDCPTILPIEKMRSLLFVLSNYLSVAPCEEDLQLLLPYVRQLKEEISMRVFKPGSG